MTGELTSIWVKFGSDIIAKKVLTLNYSDFQLERNSSQAEILWFPADEGIGQFKLLEY